MRTCIKKLLGLLNKPNFFKSVVETFITRIIIVLVSLVTTVIVARLLGPEGRGLYTIASTIGALGIQFGCLGLHSANTNFMSKDKTLLPTLVSNSLAMSFGLVGLLSLAIWCFFILWPQLAPIHGVLLGLALLWIPFGLEYLLLQSVLLGMQAFRLYNVIELVGKLLGILLIMLLLLKRSVSVETVYGMNFIALLITVVWVSWAVIRKCDRIVIPSVILFKQSVSYGIKLFWMCLFIFCNNNIVLFMIQYKFGAEQVGYYSIATMIADTIVLLPVSINTILFPKLSALMCDEEKWRITYKTAIYTLIVMIVLSGIAFVLVKPVIQLLFGIAFLPSSTVFVWLIPGIITLSVVNIFSAYIASKEIPRALVLFYFLVCFLSVILYYLFLLIFGIVGAAFIRSSCNLIIMIGVIFIAWKIRKTNK